MDFIQKKFKGFAGVTNTMNYNFTQSDIINQSFEDLLELSSVTKSRFKIIGNSKEFIIKANADNVVVGIGLLVILAIPSILLYQDYNSWGNWVFMVIVTVSIFLFFKYFPSTNDILIDTNSKKITIRSNNFIGKYLVPTKEISFGEIKYFTTKKISIGQELKSHYNRVYIECRNRKVHIIDLLNGPFYYINHRAFIKPLDRIIKTAA